MRFCISLLLLLYTVLVFVIASVVDDEFFNSCRAGDIDKVVKYLENGTPVNSRDAKGNSGLVIAAGRGKSEIVKLLLNNGADPNDYTAAGLFEYKTALQWACSQGRTETAAVLINAGADPHNPPERGVFGGKTALMWASSQGRKDVVRLLLSVGVNPDFSSSSGNFKGKSALMWASSQGRVDTVAILLEAGCNVNAVDTDGVSALMWAAGSEAANEENHKKGLMEKATKGHAEVIKLLLKYGADPDMRDNDGITAIMFAAFHGLVGPVRVLLNVGANADFSNGAGKTALQLARNSGHDGVVDVILQGPTFMNVTFTDLKEMTSCGWLLSVLRAPSGTGIIPKRQYRNPRYVPDVSISASCQALTRYGLNVNMQEFLALLQTSTSIENFVSNFGITVYAASLRAKMQLSILYHKYRNDIEHLTNYHASQSLLDSVSGASTINDVCKNNANSCSRV